MAAETAGRRDDRDTETIEFIDEELDELRARAR